MDLIRNLARNLTAAPIFAAIFVVSLLYLSSLMTLWQKWVLWDQDLAHAIPTIGVMLVLLVRSNYAIKDTHPTNLLYGLLLVATAGCSLAWYLFESLSISLPAYLLLTATLCLFIGAALSPSAMLGTLPILGLLLFTIPIWSELTGVLVELSTLVVGKMVKLSNLTVLIDGSSLFIPSGTIHIADGCSGIRYLIISLLMGYILILINQYRLRTAIITLFAAGALGLFANWLRIYLLVLIGYNTDMQSSLMHDHETFGWILFACLLIPAIYFAPINRPPNKIINISKRPGFLALVAVSVGPLLLYINTSTPSPHFPLQLSHLDAFKITTSEPIGTELSPGITRVDKRLIELEGLKIRVDLFAHTPSSAREEIVPYIQGLTDRSNWSIEQSHSQSKFNLAIYKKVGGNTRVVIATQYIVGKIETEKYIAAKFLQLVANAAGDKYFGLLTAQTNCANDCQDELNKLTRALASISVPQS
ncbi:exosortase/archaeosortase family protein [Cellvibrio sp. OA-2007]|uniref:exosortase/archaeosortase family protein n=1 Tax=Cellvibrio sp. OA-2007 TaxID=529823 RepID=UPI0007814902|nr:exosortase/archaeosortase family protein [Cellvibrio sp. OA-2007]